VEFAIAGATVSFHLGNLGAANATPYAGRRAIVEMLGRGAVCVSELCDLRLRDVPLHDPDGARFRIPDSNSGSAGSALGTCAAGTAPGWRPGPAMSLVRLPGDEPRTQALGRFSER
jgi:hypothetical protein